MTDMVCRPEKAPIVKGKGLYMVYMNRKPLGLHIRAKTAAEADEMLQVVFRHELPGKTLDYDLHEFEHLREHKPLPVTEGKEPQDETQGS